MDAAIGVLTAAHSAHSLYDDPPRHHWIDGMARWYGGRAREGSTRAYGQAGFTQKGGHSRRSQSSM